ncbi:MAG: FtsX-like permease family protein [Acidobacteriota bacterium]
MKTSRLIKQNLLHFWRTNLAVISGVATAVAVLAGALLVGDSVRASLRELFLSRLGNTDYIISSTSFFREPLAADLQANNQFSANFKAACPVITLNGYVTHEKSKQSASQVQVYGIDERFWQFHGKTAHPIEDRELLMSEALAAELGSNANDSILLRIEKPSAIPAGSLHGKKDDLGRTIRLSMREALSESMLGSFSLRPQQGQVRAIFVSLRRLQKDLEMQGKANALLIQGSQESGVGSRESGKVATLAKILKEQFALEDLGLKLRVLEDQSCIQLESDSAIINDTIADEVKTVAASSGAKAEPVLSYLANTISTESHAIPYSLVTAFDETRLATLTKSNPVSRNTSAKNDASHSTQTAPQNATGNAESGYANPRAAQGTVTAQSPPIILNDWAASDLHARVGDVITLEYYVWQEDGKLETARANFRLAGVTSIAGAAADRNLVPDYPGISDTASLSDWDPPFPVDLKRVRPKDDAYWKQYRTTPKAFIELPVGQRLWQTRYGRATSMRIYPEDKSDLQSSLANFKTRLRDALDPVAAGLVVFDVKAQGLKASQGATDFGEYFIYFSFFLVVSALMLASLFFKLGIEQRVREIGLLRAIGFSNSKVRNLFLIEGVMLAALGSLIGIVAAIIFAWLLMVGLKTFWVGAVGTTLLRLHISPISLIFGSLGGVIAALLCIWWTLRALKRAAPRALLSGVVVGDQSPVVGEKNKRQGFAIGRLFSARVAAIIFAILGFALLAMAATNRIGQVAGFFGAGISLLVALLGWQSVWLRSENKSLLKGKGFRAVSAMGFRNATYRAGRSVLCIALIASAAFIIVAVDAFRRDVSANAFDKKSGTGGFPLLAETLLNLHYDPATVDGREELNITADSRFSPDMVAFTRFRLRRGEDTSCLNLYQPHNPRILGATDDFIQSNRFTFQDSLAQTAEEKANPWLLLNKDFSESNSKNQSQSSTSSVNPQSTIRNPQLESPQSVIPVIVDANSLTYVLHLKLGDEFLLEQTGKAALRLKIVAALSDSLFQSEFLMSEKNFLNAFINEGGYGFFLLDVESQNQTAVTAALEEKLSDYGFDVMSTAERLASFHRVENTYISTFQTLGALGLLLGTLGLATVLLRNVLERRKELALLKAIGYNARHFSLMVIAENALLLICGLVTGTACALLAIAPAFLARGGHLPTVSLALLLLAVLATGLLASVFATRAALRLPLLASLRAE